MALMFIALFRGGIVSLAFMASIAASQALGASAQEKRMPPALARDVHCMVRVLKTMPQIDHVKSELDMLDGELRAHVSFRNNSRAGKGLTVNYFSTGSEPQYQFCAPFSGLTTPGHTPETYGSNVITKAWKDRCAVSAGAFFP